MPLHAGLWQGLCLMLLLLLQVYNHSSDSELFDTLLHSHEVALHCLACMQL